MSIRKHGQIYDLTPYTETSTGFNFRWYERRSDQTWWLLVDGFTGRIWIAAEHVDEFCARLQSIKASRP